MSEQNNGAELRQIITDALVSMVSGVTGLVPPAGPGQIPDFIQAPIDRAVEKISASLPVGVPDGYALVPVEPTTKMYMAGAEAYDKHLPFVYGNVTHVFKAMLAAAPTVKAEQVPTPEFVWVRLLEALAGDNGCSFATSTDDYREAKPALIQLIKAGFFRDDADSLEGDVWTVAAGEQGEAAARFARCSEAYAVLSDVLNRVFDRPEEAPSLPAAGSVVEVKALRAYDQPVRVAIQMLERTLSPTAMEIAAELRRCLGDAQDALTAQQSAPERVSVLCEALEDARRAMFAVLNQEPRMKAVAKRVLNAEIDRIDRALLASHAEGGKV